MNRLRELRKQKKLTLKELSQELTKNNFKITPDAIAKYETSKREPKLETWQKLADFFDAPVPYLQGFGLSNEQAVNIAWKWAHGEVSDTEYDIFEILRAFFKSHYNNEKLQEIFKNKQSFSKFMNKRFKSVFNYYSLSTMQNSEDLERALAIVAGDILDSIQAQIDSIDFKNDSNDRIHEILGQIFTDVLTYVDSHR